ncbi:ecotin family protein [Fusobacterium gonidiaformans]|nr:ecotin family protein [Fusobacterium gonidiaformans]
MKKILLFLVLALSFSMFAFGENMELDIYPKAKKGTKQEIFILDKQEKEEDYKIELRFGKDIKVDCNVHSFLHGNLEEKSVEGWSYPYYIFQGSNDMVQTLMLCQEGKKLKRVYYPSATRILPYNSKLPVVIYVPKDVKVEVHIWKHSGVKEASR